MKMPMMIALLSLLAVHNSFAMGKKLEPIPSDDKVVNVQEIYNTVLIQDEVGLPGGCKVNRQYSSLLDSLAILNISGPNNIGGNLTIENPSEEYSDVTQADGSRVLRIGQYQFRDLSNDYDKTVTQLKFNSSGKITSIKQWELSGLSGPTTNDPENTNPGFGLICE